MLYNLKPTHYDLSYYLVSVWSTKRHLSTSLTSDYSADHMLGELSVQFSALSIEEVKIDHRLHSKPLNH